VTGMRKQSHPRLREALKILGGKHMMHTAPKAFKLIIWELMRTQTEFNKLRDYVKKMGKRFDENVDIDIHNLNESRKAFKEVRELICHLKKAKVKP
jgi:hypothetical protein